MHSRFMRDDRGRFRAGRIIGVTVGGLVLATLLAVGLGWLVQWLWNNLMTVLFKLPAITYWQAVGLFLLGKLLFGGHPGGHPGHHAHKHAHAHYARWQRCGRGCEEEVSQDHEQFQAFWENEGKTAFQAYLEKLKRSEQV
jgi:hypothetical protein